MSPFLFIRAKFINKFFVHMTKGLATRSSYTAYQKNNDCGFDTGSNLCPEFLCALSVERPDGGLVICYQRNSDPFTFAKEGVIQSTPDDGVMWDISSPIL